jgi:hypothetical protein
MEAHHWSLVVDDWYVIFVSYVVDIRFRNPSFSNTRDGLLINSGDIFLKRRANTRMESSL